MARDRFTECSIRRLAEIAAGRVDDPPTLPELPPSRATR